MRFEADAGGDAILPVAQQLGQGRGQGLAIQVAAEEGLDVLGADALVGGAPDAGGVDAVDIGIAGGRAIGETGQLKTLEAIHPPGDQQLAVMPRFYGQALLALPRGPVSQLQEGAPVGCQAHDIFADIHQAQPVHGAGDAELDQRAFDGVPALEAAQVFAGLVADVPAVVIAIGALEIWLEFLDGLDQVVDGDPALFGQQIAQQVD